MRWKRAKAVRHMPRSRHAMMAVEKCWLLSSTPVFSSTYFSTSMHRAPAPSRRSAASSRPRNLPPVSCKTAQRKSAVSHLWSLSKSA
eukprot:1344336-Pyramimonas_sp.AAC.1